MAVVLTYGASLPVIKMGRMAGQYAKPRSSGTETRDGVTLPAFRGRHHQRVRLHARGPHAGPAAPARGVPHVRVDAEPHPRVHDRGGFASLLRVHEWNRGFTTNPAYKRYEEIAAEIDRAIRFMAACGGADFDALRTVDFYSSHEGLLLDYERPPLTRIDSRTGLPYDCSAHFVWIGERTRELTGAHIDYFSRVQNPIGVKLGPTSTGDDAIALIDKLNRRGGRRGGA